MTIVVTHTKVSTKAVGNDSTRIYSDSWNANHAITGTADASQLNANVVQAVTNDTNIQGSIAAQTLTFSWAGTLAAARLNTNVVQAITNDTNVTGSISAQNLTIAWTGQLGLARGGTNADLSATGGTSNYLKQASVGAAVTVGPIPASDIASGAAITKVDDTNVTLTLGGTPATAALKATSLTLGWTGTLAASRGGFGADVSAQSGVPLFAAGVPTFTSTSGSGNFVRVTNGVLVTPQLGTPQSGVLTNCTGLPLAGLATQAAWTFLVNNTSGSAAPTAQDIHSLTLKASPASTDEVIIWDIAGSALKRATVSGVGASAGVSSIAGNTGAFTLSHGLTNSANDIQLSLTNAVLATTTVATPTATTSATPVMMGMGTTFKLTPVYSGRVHVTIQGVIGNTVTLNGTSIQLRYGTGVAPVNGAAASGTTVGNAMNNAISGASTTVVFAVSGTITGLTPGTAYWFDLGVSVGGGTSILANLSCAADEF